MAEFELMVADCNGTATADYCDILQGLSEDCHADGVPSECEADCSGDGAPDACEPDCNGNGAADPCDIAGFASLDCNQNGIPDERDGSDTKLYEAVYSPAIILNASTSHVQSLYVDGSGTVADLNLDLVTLDVLREIDLVNGAGAYEPYLGISLP